MREKEFHPETYSLARTTIEAVTTARKYPGALQNFEWPIELQGCGESDEKQKTILIRFPKGDVFLSYAITIHELGHPRQEELNPTLKIPENGQTHAILFAQEDDAWSRGWKRFSTANPEAITELEEKFQRYRAGGKLQLFPSFEALFRWIREHALRMVEAQRILFESSGKIDDANADALAQELKKAGIQDFLEKFTSARVGEIVDDEEIRETITATIKNIITE